MNYKELLEFSAKACGFNGDYDENEECMILHYYDGNDLLFKDWNPLTDDGDAIRLAVKLELWVCVQKKEVSAISDKLRARTNIDSDPYAATRYAITRAAAEIGKNIG